ncbi:MAG: hypothetical protein K0U68_10605 [Gammaproteobacteria bacterium]|nr:hypothetical protein [Gammaproteobacteria bacterium]
MAKNLQELESAIEQLPQKELSQFRAWYEKFDSDVWDKQIEEDSSMGKLDELAQAALDDHYQGKSKKAVNHFASPSFGRLIISNHYQSNSWPIKILRN